MFPKPNDQTQVKVASQNVEMHDVSQKTKEPFSFGEILQELEIVEDDFCDQQLETLERLRTQLDLCERLQMKKEYIQQYK